MIICRWQAYLTGLAPSMVLSLSLSAQVQPPFCQFTKPANPLPEVHFRNPVHVPNEVLRATVLTPRREIKIEIETNADGKLECATPLRFPASLLIPHAILAIENSLADKTIPPSESPRLIIFPDPRPLPPRGHPRVIVVPDPYHPPPEALRNPELEKLTCESQNVDELLDVIRQLGHELSVENVHKQIQCMNAAVSRLSDLYDCDDFTRNRRQRAAGIPSEVARTCPVSVGTRPSIGRSPGSVEDGAAQSRQSR
jgi:hypothetical protein